MGTELSIVMCYRDFGDPWRQQSYAYARPWYGRMAQTLGAEFVLDDGDGGHAAAINRGVKTANGDVIVLVDSDSLALIERVAQAALWAKDSPGLVVPHTRYVYLSPASTKLVYAGAAPFDPTLQSEFSGPGGVGNAVVFSRHTWETVGGYDERFYAWGGDDTAFNIACEAVHAPTRRIEGDVVHLYHERSEAERTGRRAPDIQQVLDGWVAAEKAGPRAVLQYMAGR